MNPSISKSCLSPAQTRLLELLQNLNFGRVEQLRVRAGEPTFDPPPRIVQTVKLGADNGPRPERSYADFRLKHQVVEMLDIVSSLEDGEIRAIDIQHGLPYRLEIDRPPDYSGDAHNARKARDDRNPEKSGDAR